MECPACGSTQLTEVLDVRRYTPPYGEEVIYEVPMLDCNECEDGYEGEGAAAAVYGAHNEANAKSVVAMLEWLVAKGYSTAYVERALNLPSGLLQKWKKREEAPTAEGIALLRVVRTYPWILHVSRARYDPKAAHQLLAETRDGVP